MKTAFVFPGQGSQYAGMGREIAERYDVAREVFREADSVLGFSLSDICFNGPEDALKLTENTQPAILVTSIAIYRVLEEKGIQPDFVAGHSLGEYSALVAAGALKLSDAVGLVRRRGQYMQQAVPVGVGAMAAILGLEAAAVCDVCERASEGQVVSPANLNSQMQTVIAGNREAVERAAAFAKQAGAKRAIMLPVSAPFHCALMKPAEERLAVDLTNLPFADLRIPLVANVDGAVANRGEDARRNLERQVSRPVRWRESVERLSGEGVTRFVEVGPGSVLIGLVRSIDKSATILNAEDEKSLEKVLSGLL
jgi:[acyl-carrier-protein] S-malonyltransferase